MVSAALLFIKGVSWQVWAAIALAGALVASHWWAYGQGEDARQAKWDAAEVQRKADQQAADDADAHRMNKAALRYEENKAGQLVRFVTVTKEVSHALEAVPDWAREPVPVGVRDAIAAAVGQAPAASEPDGTVRVPGAGGPDERAAGPGLRVGPREPRRLLGAALGPG